MRLHISGNGTAIAADVLGEIAERLEALNGFEADIFEARVKMDMHEPHAQCGGTIQVALMLGGQTLSMTCSGVTPQDAVDAVLRELTPRLQAFRNQRRRKRTIPPGFELS